jgi:hypothetical protein
MCGRHFRRNSWSILMVNQSKSQQGSSGKAQQQGSQDKSGTQRQQGSQDKSGMQHQQSGNPRQSQNDQGTMHRSQFGMSGQDRDNSRDSGKDIKDNK